MPSILDKTMFIPGPEPSLELCYNDIAFVGLYSRRILCFRLPAKSDPSMIVQLFQRALDALIRENPELAGQVVVLPPSGKGPYGNYATRAIRHYKGLELRIKDLTDSFASFDELATSKFRLSDFDDDLLMPVPAEIQPDPLPVTVLQLNFVQGGVLLSFCMHHVYTDGNGMNAVMSALAGQCRLAASDASLQAAPKLNTDRTPFETYTGSMKSIEEHPAFKYIEGAMNPAIPLPAHSTDGPTIFRLKFRLTNTKAEAMKTASVSAGATNCSTHDMISALIWRTVVLARVKTGALSDSAQTTFQCPHDVRKHCSLRNDYVGNCTDFIAPSLPASVLLQCATAADLVEIAKCIRQSLQNISADKVRSLLELKRQAPFDYPFTMLLELENPGFVVTTSFYHSNIYKMDWGAAFGDMEHFTPSNAGATGESLPRTPAVLAKFPGGKGCDVQVSLEEAEMEVFQHDEMWNTWMESAIEDKS